MQVWTLYLTWELVTKGFSQLISQSIFITILNWQSRNLCWKRDFFRDQWVYFPWRPTGCKCFLRETIINTLYPLCQYLSLCQVVWSSTICYHIGRHIDYCYPHFMYTSKIWGIQSRNLIIGFKTNYQKQVWCHDSSGMNEWSIFANFSQYFTEAFT